MDDLRGHNRVKAASILLLFALFLGVTLAVPSLRQSPLLEAPVEAPAAAP
jgi:hypothetical protein